MTSKKKSYSADFKAKVSLAAIREEGTLSELASRYQITPKMVSRWKQQALQQMATSFGKKPKETSPHTDEEIKRLHARIGQLTVEVDFLEEASKMLGLGGGKKW